MAHERFYSLTHTTWIDRGLSYATCLSWHGITFQRDSTALSSRGIRNYWMQVKSISFIFKYCIYKHIDYPSVLAFYDLGEGDKFTANYNVFIGGSRGRVRRLQPSPPLIGKFYPKKGHFLLFLGLQPPSPFQTQWWTK